MKALTVRENLNIFKYGSLSHPFGRVALPGSSSSFIAPKNDSATELSQQLPFLLMEHRK